METAKITSDNMNVTLTDGSVVVCRRSRIDGRYTLTVYNYGLAATGVGSVSGAGWTVVALNGELVCQKSA